MRNKKRFIFSCLTICLFVLLALTNASIQAYATTYYVDARRDDLNQRNSNTELPAYATTSYVDLGGNI